MRVCEYIMVVREIMKYVPVIATSLTPELAAS